MSTANDLQFVPELRAVINRFIKKLRKESPSGLQLSATERSTMAQLYQHKALQPSELAAMEMVTNQSMSQVLNHLSELCFIIRVPSKTDKRKVNISLSAEGETKLLQFRNERDEWMAKAISEACTAEEQMILKQVIEPLAKLVDYK